MLVLGTVVKLFLQGSCAVIVTKLVGALVSKGHRDLILKVGLYKKDIDMTFFTTFRMINDII